MDGKPLGGAIVKISDTSSYEGGDGTCSKHVMAISTTDSLGQFELKGGDKFRLLEIIPGFHIYKSELCIIADGTVSHGYSTLTTAPLESVFLNCNLGSTNDLTKERMGMDRWCPECPCQIQRVTTQNLRPK
jgi:hypothetical protein